MQQDDELELTPAMEAASRSLIASLEDAFNAHDPKAISEHFAEEAAWATVMGKELAGRQAIETFGRSIIDRLQDSYARYAITRLVPVAKKAVAVRVLQTPVTADGTPTDAPSGAGLYVIARRGRNWKVCAGQITFVGE